MNEASIKIIFKNTPRCEDFSGSSFVGILHENYEWDEKQYWLLDKYLYDLVSDYESIDFSTIYAMIVRAVFNKIYKL